jgi:ABC-type transport system involved in cytochrome c biogenesis permease subunit
MAMSVESLLLLPALGCYAGAGASAWVGMGPRGPALARATALLLAAGLILHTASLALRWQAMGHGPFTTMYEILSSNVWSLTLVFAIVWARVREARAAALIVLPVILLLAAWLLAADAAPGHFPPTYFTVLLYVHALLGKVYLGLLLVAVGVSALVWLRRSRWGARRLAALPPDAALDELAYRFAAFAFVFDTLMLTAGAVWAQDAWGRYWAWDPLETWAFLSWLALASALHARASLRVSARAHALLLAAAFALAFLTFFGVPFVSTSPHKGAV